MNERGAALVLALLVVVCLSGLGLGLAATSAAERQVAANTRGGVDTALAADAVVEGVLPELSMAADWSSWIAGATTRFHDTTRKPLTPSGVRLDLDQLTVELQAEMASTHALGPNTPVWHLVGWGTLASLAGLPADASANYVAVWVADDPSETDGRPEVDANQTLLLHGEAFGRGASRRGVDVVIQRAPTGARVLSWRSR